MYALGIESTAHTFGVGIVDESAHVLANEKSTYTHPTAGIHPAEAARHHQRVGKSVLEKALNQATISFEDIDVISFAQGPGLGPCLRVGAITARYLSTYYSIPLLGVNHCVAHIEIGKIKTGARDPLVVYTSGANTQIIARENNQYCVLGETLDMGIGNAFDQFGRSLGIGFPAGPELDSRYSHGKKYLPLPYSVKGMDLVFAGLLTEATRTIGKVEMDDLCYSFLHTAYAMITEVAERGMAHAGKKELMVTGGVAASDNFCSMLENMCVSRGASFHRVPRALAMDNGAMIAWQGLIEHRSGRKQKISETIVDQRYRTDQVSITW